MAASWLASVGEPTVSVRMRSPAPRRARCAPSAERERRAHELQELAAADRVEPGGRLGRVLAGEERLQRRRVGQLLEAPPPDAAGLAHRWHVSQLVSCVAFMILYSVTSFRPTAS